MYYLLLSVRERKKKGEIKRRDKKIKKSIIYQNIKKIAYTHIDGYVFIKLTHARKKNTKPHSHTYQTIHTINLSSL